MLNQETLRRAYTSLRERAVDRIDRARNTRSHVKGGPKKKICYRVSLVG